MAQIKAQNVSWLDQAWTISIAIADMPESQPWSLLTGEGKLPALSELHRKQVENLQDRIALHLAYRSRMVHKVPYAFPDGEKALISPYSRNPVATGKLLACLNKTGIKLQNVDLWAYDAHMKLGRILIDRYVCKEWKRLLPLIVASLGGEFTSQTATLMAIQPRNRKVNELKDGKETALCRNPYASWKELLDDLQGDAIVTEWDEKKIHWLDAEGNGMTTATQTFKNWKRQKK